MRPSSNGRGSHEAAGWESVAAHWPEDAVQEVERLDDRLQRSDAMLGRLVKSKQVGAMTRPDPRDFEPEASLFPAPLSASELEEIADPTTEWLVRGLLPIRSNLLLVGHPKTHKTNFILDLGVALASGTPFLSRQVAEPKRIGLVFMEDQPHRLKRRLQRLCQGRGLRLADLGDRLLLWPRPPLRLNSPDSMNRLAAYVHQQRLDVLVVDSWMYVSSGNSDDAGDVERQLAALSGLRDVAPDLTVGLVHHARKTGRDSTEDRRMTEILRGSGAFGAWYDAGVLLARKTEQHPVTVRAELRDAPSLEPFAFAVEDEVPAEGWDSVPSGWMRLRVLDTHPALAERQADLEAVIPLVEAFLREHPGCSKEQLKKGVKGRDTKVIEAFELMCDQGGAEYEAPAGAGLPGRCRLVEPSGQGSAGVSEPRNQE